MSKLLSTTWCWTRLIRCLRSLFVTALSPSTSRANMRSQTTSAKSEFLRLLFRAHELLVDRRHFSDSIVTDVKLPTDALLRRDGKEISEQDQPAALEFLKIWLSETAYDQYMEHRTEQMRKEELKAGAGKRAADDDAAASRKRKRGELSAALGLPELGLGGAKRDAAAAAAAADSDKDVEMHDGGEAKHGAAEASDEPDEKKAKRPKVCFVCVFCHTICQRCLQAAKDDDKRSGKDGADLAQSDPLAIAEFQLARIDRKSTRLNSSHT